MPEAKTAALLGAVALAGAIWLRRRRVFDISCLAAFVASYLALVIIGVLVAPWALEYQLLQVGFPYLHWEYLTDADVTRTIAIVTGGVLLVIVGDAFVDGIRLGIGQRRPARCIIAFAQPPTGFPRMRARTLLVIAGGAIAILLARQIPTLRLGFIEGYARGDIAAQFEARYQMQQLGRPFYFLALTTLPMLAVLGWMKWLEGGTWGDRTWAAIAVTGTSLVLLATFEKRPLVLFILTLAMVLTIRRMHLGPSNAAHRPMARIPWGVILGSLGLGLCMLIGFYFLSTGAAKVYGVGGTLLLVLLGITAIHIIGRLSQMPLFYSHYFPAVHSFYGLTNVGVLAALGGSLPYPDTANVYAYFSGLPEGAGAIGAISDFYAAFGWLGWAVACVALGATLNMMDRWLTSLRPTYANRTFYIMMLVFTSTLSQASLPRSLSTYGGVLYVVIWLFLTVRIVPRITPTSAT